MDPRIITFSTSCSELSASHLFLFTPRKEPPLPHKLNRKLGGPKSQFGCFRGQTNLQLFLRIKPELLSQLACNAVLCHLSYPDSLSRLLLLLLLLLFIGVLDSSLTCLTLLPTTREYASTVWNSI
jgi:hypothetical protein